MTWDLFSTADPAHGGADAPRAEPGAVSARVETFSVSQVNALVRRLLEGGIPPLWVGGEISGWKRSAQDHCYFTLKDEQAQLRCVMFARDSQRLPADPDEGMRVRALGGLTVYEKRGDYQLVVRRLEAGEGDGLWRLAFERLRERLDAEGLLAPARKRPLPRCPDTIGVVTSAGGAVLHDILHVLERRAPWTRVVLAPARVQGDGAAAEIAAALARLGRAGGVDVIIVGRGGGSAEDLWPFNEEPVARAIAAAPVPVISAVGHETDVTIADLVADVRAPTPSAAAELAVPDRQTIERELDAVAGRLRAMLGAQVERRARRLDALHGRLRGAGRALLREPEARLTALAGRLQALSPLAALSRGYAVPVSAEGRVLRRASSFPEGTRFRLRVVDGSVPCGVVGPVDVDSEAGPTP